MIKFRDETAKKYGLEMIEYINEDGVKQGVNPFDQWSRLHRYHENTGSKAGVK